MLPAFYTHAWPRCAAAVCSVDMPLYASTSGSEGGVLAPEGGQSLKW